MKDDKEKTREGGQAPKAYKAPSLQEYGSIRELTTSGSNKKWEGHPVFTGPGPRP
ncbi:MAG: lasso RiPP family leader peptide-containing protein [Lentisphaeria bacterium]|jgi:hypothetical protein|nr:lasso RiPP family leader peptide-containing protein [Lentisphaeria bacterium]